MSSTQRNALLALGIGLLGSLLFVGSLGHGFSMDDTGLIEVNRLSRGIDQLPQIFRTDYWHPTMDSGLYRPLAKASYVLNWELGGLDPSGFHATNVILHGIVCAILFAFLLRVTQDSGFAALASLLFAVHAVHTEVTANITYGRPELLSAMFALLTALAYLGIRDSDPLARRLLWLGASMLALLLALYSKESAVTILGIIGLYDVCYRTPDDEPLWKRIWLALRARSFPYYVGLCAVVAGYMLFRVVALAGQKLTPPHIAIDNPILGLEQPWRLINALYVALFHYFRLLVVPYPLSYDYSFNAIPLITEAGDPKLLLTAVGVVVATVGSIWAYRRKHRTLFFGIAFFLLTFATVSNVFVLIGTVLGERLLYFPSVGYCIMLAVGLRALASRFGPGRATTALVVTTCVVMALHAWRAIERTGDWVDEYTLYTRDAETVSGSTKAHNNAGAVRIRFKEYEEGLASLKRAIEIAPLGYHTPYYTSGITLTTLGRDDEAIEMYEGSLLNGDPDPITRNNLGYLLIDRDIDVDRGISLIEEAIEIMPEYPEFRDSLAWGLYKKGELKGAREQMLKAIELDTRKGRVVDGRQERLDLIENAIQLRKVANSPSL